MSAGQSPPEVCVIILNWNGWRETLECLESVRRLDYPRYRLVVVDNGSTDDSRFRIHRWATEQDVPLEWVEYERVKAEGGGSPAEEADVDHRPAGSLLVFIATGANLGYAGGNNVGIRYAQRRGADYIWLLNNDTVVEQGALAEMVRLLDREPHAAVCGAKVLSYDQPEVLLAAGGGWFDPCRGLSYHYGALERDGGRWDRSFEPEYVTGASLFFRTAAAAQVGLMREGYFLYGEELEWQMRLRRAGWGVRYCPTARVWHKENAATGRRSPTVEFYYTRNLLWITKHYAPWGLPSALVVHLLRAIRRAATGQFGRAGAVMRGILAGLRPDGSEMAP